MTAHHRSVIATAGPAIDWPRFARLVARHRIAPLAFEGLRETLDAIPDEPRHDLRNQAQRARVQALRLVGALATVSTCLVDAGIPSASIKGPVLGLVAFGDASSRQCRDLDLLIAPHDVERALAILCSSGFALVSPAGFANSGRLDLWVRLMKDVSLYHEASGALVEIHWRLNDNPHLLPASVAESRQTIAMGTLRVDTLAADDLMLHLCAHGARHHWFRLKWLADVYALLADHDVSACERFHRYACENGLDIVAGQMLLLLNRIYGMDVPTEVSARVAISRRTQWLVNFAEKQLRAQTEPGTTRFTSTAMAVMSPLLRCDRRFTLHEIAHALVDWPTVISLGGSRSAYVIATLGRPLFWIARKLGLGAALRR